ncbi:MAG: hypothetical protein IJI75_12385 [Solobacterium sp.]|nr:hypothetical protein [Solobacterium sp.]
MKRFAKYILKCILFAGIVAGLLFAVNGKMMPVYTYRNSNWPTTSTFNQFYRMEKDSVDVLFFGSSFAVNAFNPQVIYDETGLRTYSLASEQQSPFISYYWLREALKYQKPQAVILETRYLFHRESNTPVNMNESFLRKSIEPMKFSSVKRELVSTLCGMDQNQNSWSYYFTNLEYHTRWKELTWKELLSDDARHAELKGYGPLFVTNTDHFAPVIPEETDITIPMEPLMQEYLGKMEELCAENGIRLILVTVPSSDMHIAMHDELTSYCEEHGLDYYDYSEQTLFDTCGWDLTVENPVDHMNYLAALRMSGIIGDLLKDRYHIEPVQDQQWEETRSYGAMIGEKASLSGIKDIDEYRNALSQGDYVLFVSLDEASDKFDDLLKTIGISQHSDRLLAVIHDQEIIAFADGAGGSGGGTMTEYDLEWEMKQDEEGTSIILNGSSFARKKTGLHITVYDPQLNKVIDEVCFSGQNGHMTAVRDLDFMNE